MNEPTSTQTEKPATETNTPAKAAEPQAPANESAPKPGPAATLVVGTVAEHEERLRKLEGVAPEAPPEKDGKTRGDSSSWLTLF